MSARPGAGLLAALLALGLARPAVAEGQQAQPRHEGTQARAAGAAQPGMQHLQQAAQQLREAMQAMAQQPPGQHRDTAMKQAEDALLHAQEAMAQAALVGKGEPAASAAGSDAGGSGGSGGGPPPRPADRSSQAGGRTQ